MVSTLLIAAVGLLGKFSESLLSLLSYDFKLIISIRVACPLSASWVNKLLAYNLQ